MLRNICLLITFFFFINVSLLKAQQPDEQSVAKLEAHLNELYGPDQFLVNGVRYYNTHISMDGHKFYGEDEFTRGKLVLEDNQYHDVFLKYNLLDQQLILQHFFNKQVYYEIILSNSRISEFELDGKIFRKCYFPSTDTRFFQVLGDGDLACYYHWTKMLVTTYTESYRQGEFSNQKRKSYLLWQSKLYEFKGARSFARIFAQDQSQVLRYIRNNRIRIKKATDAEMKELIIQCNRIIRS
ncbi:hypothetical protein ACFLSP_01255 [Bacteroidota bacterium]